MNTRMIYRNSQVIISNLSSASLFICDRLAFSFLFDLNMQVDSEDPHYAESN